MNGTSTWGPAVVIVLGYVIGFYFQNRWIDDLRGAVNQRFGAVDARFNSVGARFSDLKDFIKSEIPRVVDRIDRLEQPVAKP